jgi:hypothetical protein
MELFSFVCPSDVIQGRRQASRDIR